MVYFKILRAKAKAFLSPLGADQPSVQSRRFLEGYSLIELLMVIALLGLIVTVSLLPVTENLDQGKVEATLQKLKSIRSALIAYEKDIGGLPATSGSLPDLVTRPNSISAWTLDLATQVGAGWNGPYLNRSSDSGISNWSDAWGTPLVFDPAASPPTLKSLGADLTAGGTGMNADLTVIIPTGALTGTLHGVIQDHGSPWSGIAEIEIHIPDPTSGQLKHLSTSVHSEDNGAFTFNAIPLGQRSITLYLPNKGSPTSTRGPFRITLERPHTTWVGGTASHPIDLTSSP